MIETLSYYTSVFYKDFVDYTSGKLEEKGMHFGSIFFMIYIGKHPGCSPSELTESLKIDWGHSQRSLTKLEKDGFIIKKKEGRYNKLWLTEKGKETFEISHNVFYEWDEAHLSTLTDEEREQLTTLLGKVGSNRG